MKTINRPAARRRAEALAAAIEIIEAEFGPIGPMIVDGTMPVSIPLGDAVMHGYPPGTDANDVEIESWELLMLLKLACERYTDEVLGPSEAA